MEITAFKENTIVTIKYSQILFIDKIKILLKWFGMQVQFGLYHRVCYHILQKDLQTNSFQVRVLKQTRQLGIQFYYDFLGGCIYRNF